MKDKIIEYVGKGTLISITMILMMGFFTTVNSPISKYLLIVTILILTGLCIVVNGQLVLYCIKYLREK